MKNTFADRCLERADKALTGEDSSFTTWVPIAAYEFPELARRLKKAIDILTKLHNKDPFFAFLYADIKELEAIPEEK